MSYELMSMDPTFEAEAGANSWLLMKALGRGSASGIIKAGAALADMAHTSGAMLAEHAASQSSPATADADAAVAAQYRLERQTEAIFSGEPGHALRRQADRFRLPDEAEPLEKAAFAVGEVIAPAAGAAIVAGPVAGPAIFGATRGMNESHELKEAGVDLGTRSTVGAVTGAIEGLQMGLPMVGPSTRINAALALSSPGLYMGQMGTSSYLLEEGGYSDLASLYDFMDPLGLGLSTGFGLFGFGLGQALKQAGRVRTPGNALVKNVVKDVSDAGATGTAKTLAEGADRAGQAASARAAVQAGEEVVESAAAGKSGSSAARHSTEAADSITASKTAEPASELRSAKDIQQQHAHETYHGKDADLGARLEHADTLVESRAGQKTGEVVKAELSTTPLLSDVQGKLVNKVADETRGVTTELIEAAEKVREFYDYAVAHPRDNGKTLVFSNQISESKRIRILHETYVDIGNATELIESSHVRHSVKDHPKLKRNDWSLLPWTAEKFEKVQILKPDRNDKGIRFGFLAIDEVTGSAYVAEALSGAKKGNRLKTVTFYKDHVNSTISWIQNDFSPYKPLNDIYNSTFRLEDQIREAGLLIDIDKLERLAAALEHNPSIKVKLIGMQDRVNAHQALQEVDATLKRLRLVNN